MQLAGEEAKKLKKRQACLLFICLIFAFHSIRFVRLILLQAVGGGCTAILPPWYPGTLHLPPSSAHFSTFHLLHKWNEIENAIVLHMSRERLMRTKRMCGVGGSWLGPASEKRGKGKANTLWKWERRSRAGWLTKKKPNSTQLATTRVANVTWDTLTTHCTQQNCIILTIFYTKKCNIKNIILYTIWKNILV